jgi:putative CocE/NonD family hydrolase
MRHVSDFPRRVVMHDPVWITMPDDTRLAARIWLPEDAASNKVPAILEYLPYRRRDGTAVRDALTHPYFAGHGYASVRVDMRGTGDSDGLLRGEYLKQEQDDCLEVIDWITRQPWCTGTVGMIGISWGGFNGLQVAARQPAALKAIISLCSTDDRYANDIHHMGGALLTDNLRWASTMLGYQSRPPAPEIVGDRWREMWLERLNAEPLLLAEWLQHQTRDDFWKHGSVCEDPAAITAACYLVGGWADGYSNAVPRMLERLTCPRKGLIGPWAHKYPHFARPAPAIGFLQECLRWWDYWLKGLDTGVMDGPQYRVWVEEFVRPATDHAERPGRWIAEPSWPSPRIEHRQYALGDHTLGGTPGTLPPIVVATPQTLGEMSGAWCGYGSGNEAPGDQRGDDGLSVVFDSAPLEAGFDLVGAPVFEATIASDKPNAVLVARLCDVAPDGASLRLSYGVLNLTHRDSHETPTPLPVGQPVHLRLQLNDCAHAFRPGHRIRLALSSTYWPLVWPSPDAATLLLHPALSHLRLPHRPPSPDDARLPPFAEPEAAPPLHRTVLEAPVNSRTATHDQISGSATFEIRDDTGLYRIDSTDLEYRLWSLDRFSIHPDDPLSARGDVTFHMQQGRGDWQVRATSRTVLTATDTDFHIHATLDAWEGEQRLVSRNWTVSVPRVLV